MSARTSPAAIADPGPLPSFADRLDSALRHGGPTLQELSDHLAAVGITCSPATLSQWRRGRTRPRRAEALRALAVLETLLDCPTGYLTPAETGTAGGNPADRRAASREREMLRYGDEFSATRVEFGLDAAQEFDMLASVETVHLDDHRRFTGVTCLFYVRALRDQAERLLFSAYAVDDDGSPETWPRLPVPVRGARLGRQRRFPASGQVISELVLDVPVARGEAAMLEVRIVPSGGPEPARRGINFHERRTARPAGQIVVCTDFDERALPTHLHRIVPGSPETASDEPPDLGEELSLLGTRVVVATEGPETPGVGLSWQWEP